MQPKTKRDTLVDKVLLFAGVIAPGMERLHKVHAEQMANLVEKGTEADLEEFLAKATDTELLYWFSQRSLEAPLNHDAYRVYMWLFNRVFKGKFDIPDDIRSEDKPLDLSCEQLLARLRTDLRAAQFKRLNRPVKRQSVPLQPKAMPREEVTRGGDIRLDAKYHLGGRQIGFVSLCAAVA